MYKNDNIDALINELGFNIVENIKKYDKVRNALRSHIDKALGVLVNDGVYAYYLFCKSKEKEDDKVKPYSKIFISDIVNKFKEYFNKNNNDSNASHKQNDYDEERHFFQNISEDLHELLFFREVLERVLIYARYHAKALSGDKNE